MTLTGRFLQYYRETANWLERTYAFVPRLGIDRIRGAIAEDAEGLDARMQRSVDAYRDPWRDGREPVTRGQFRSALPLVPLPRVPR